MNGILSFMVLVLFTIFSFFYQQWHAGFASTFLFIVFMMLTIYEALATTTMFYRLRAERWIESKRIYAGQTQRITIKIARKLPIPLVWYAAYDPWIGHFSGMPGQMVFPWFRKEFEFTYDVSCMSRGRHELTQLSIASGDLFGLVKRTKTLKLTESFIVLPGYERLEKWSAVDALRNGQTSVSKRMTEELTSLAGVRGYQYGDRLSQIHWKASARGQGLMTKEFDQPTANHFAIILDTQKSTYNDKEFEKAVRLAASFAHFGYHRQMKYSFWYEHRGVGGAKEGSSGHHFYQTMEELAVIQPDGETSFVSFTQHAVTRIPRGTHLVLITAKLDPAISKLLLELAMKQWKVEVCIISKLSTPKEREWIHRMQGSGVNFYREMA